MNIKNKSFYFVAMIFSNLEFHADIAFYLLTLFYLSTLILVTIKIEKRQRARIIYSIRSSWKIDQNI